MRRTCIIFVGCDALAFVAGAALAQQSSNEWAGPTIARQILVPSFMKNDWKRSAFSNDGGLLLVVDSQRSFVLHTGSDRQLRPITLEQDVPACTRRLLHNGCSVARR